MIKILSVGIVMVCLADESTFSALEDDYVDKNVNPASSGVNTISELVCNTYIRKFKLPSRRINKGKDAEIGQFPFMEAVGWLIKDTIDKFEFKCGSTLISEKFLLMAGHCTKLTTINARKLTSREPKVVVLGVENILDKGTEERRPKIADISRTISYPEYRPPKRYHDIALLELQEEIEFTEFIRPACVWPYKDVDLAGQTATISGWGNTRPGLYNARAVHLQYGEVDILDNSQCDKLLERMRHRHWQGVTDGQMCAGIPEGGVDTCQSVENIGYFPSVVGVTSIGFGYSKCGEKNKPGLYTRVSYYTDWIEEIVWVSQNILGSDTVNL